MAEYELLKQLDHPNIVRLIEVFKNDRDFFLVTRFCGGNDLVREIQIRK
jgi:calcium-dependent protein kinase